MFQGKAITSDTRRKMIFKLVGQTYLKRNWGRKRVDNKRVPIWAKIFQILCLDLLNVNVLKSLANANATLQLLSLFSGW